MSGAPRVVSSEIALKFAARFLFFDANTYTLAREVRLGTRANTNRLNC